MLGILWINEQGERFVFEFQKALWGEPDVALDFWARKYKEMFAKEYGMPQWVFILMDNRQKLYAPSDTMGYPVASIREIIEKAVRE